MTLSETVAVSKRLAMLDESQDAQHVSSARLVLPPALTAGYSRLLDTPPIRQYPLAIDADTLERAAMHGHLCWRAFSRAIALARENVEDGRPITLAQAVLSGVPRRQVLRVAEIYSEHAPELLRLYAADCAELVRDAAGEYGEQVAHAAATARTAALSSTADSERGRAHHALAELLADLTAQDDASGITAAVRCARYSLASDLGEAAQGANYTAHHLGRTLASRMLPEGNARARVLGDVDRALSRILARYDGSAP